MAPLARAPAAGGDEQLGVGIGGDNRADVAPVEHARRPAGIGEGAAGAQGARHAPSGMPRNRGCASGPASSERRPGSLEQIDIGRSQAASIAAALSGSPSARATTNSDRAIEQAGIEMRQAVMRGECPRDRALARGGRAIDSNDHLAFPAAPEPTPNSAIAAQTISSAMDAMFKWTVSE